MRENYFLRIFLPLPKRILMKFYNKWKNLLQHTQLHTYVCTFNKYFKIGVICGGVYNGKANFILNFGSNDAM